MYYRITCYFFIVNYLNIQWFIHACMSLGQVKHYRSAFPHGLQWKYGSWSRNRLDYHAVFKDCVPVKYLVTYNMLRYILMLCVLVMVRCGSVRTSTFQ